MAVGPRGSTSRESPSGAGPVSNRWFAVAVTASLLCGAVILGVFVGLGRSPLLGSGVGSVSKASADPDTLVVAIARTPGGPAEWSNWARVVKYLSDELGVPTTVRYLTREDEAAKVIAEEDIDIAFVCAHHYLHLRDKGEIVGLCTPIVDGSPTGTYRVLVSADDPAACLADLEGSVISASDKSSLGGYSYLNHACDEHGINIADFFGEVRLGETQESNLRDLAAGEVRATVVMSAQVADWDLSDFKAVEVSPPVGCPPVVASADLDPAVADRIVEILVGFEAGHELPSDSHIDGFVALDEGDYAYAEEIRDACGHHTE